jgi:hypothetical protein
MEMVRTCTGAVIDPDDLDRAYRRQMGLDTREVQEASTHDDDVPKEVGTEPRPRPYRRGRR